MTCTRYAVLLLTATAVATIPRPSLAQSAGDGFLFHVPVATWTVRGGFDHAFASGDIFNFVTKQLTIDRADFSSATFGTNVAVRVSPANDLVVDVGFSNVSRLSEFRDWVDQNNQPIQQRTSLRRVPVTVGVRHYLSSRGRSIGRFAWIPAARETYVGLGAGLMQYRFHQIGDFVDFQTLNVFPDEFESKTWTPVLHALAGLDLGLGRFLLLNGEARYTWARGPMGRDYVGFKRIDLSGLAVTAGLSLRL